VVGEGFAKERTKGGEDIMKLLKVPYDRLISGSRKRRRWERDMGMSVVKVEGEEGSR
jgi:hypothetical protein